MASLTVDSTPAWDGRESQLGVRSCAQVEGRKRHEFLEGIVSVMDGHLRYFKAGYEALAELEPYLHQVPSPASFQSRSPRPFAPCPAHRPGASPPSGPSLPAFPIRLVGVTSPPQSRPRGPPRARTPASIRSHSQDCARSKSGLSTAHTR